MVFTFVTWKLRILRLKRKKIFEQKLAKNFQFKKILWKRMKRNILYFYIEYDTVFPHIFEIRDSL